LIRIIRCWLFNFLNETEPIIRFRLRLKNPRWIYNGRQYRLDRRNQLVLQSILENAEGKNIWAGYPKGFDWPRDVTIQYRIVLYRSYNNRERQEIWVYYSNSTNAFYILPFDGMEPTGNPFGTHPKGAFRVSNCLVHRIVNLDWKE